MTFNKPSKKRGTSRLHDFKEFQTLPVLVRDSLTWGVKRHRDTGICSEREMARWIIDHYDVNQEYTVGDLVNVLDLFLDDWICIRMVWCYVESGCDMVLAKLRWSEDY